MGVPLPKVRAQGEARSIKSYSDRKKEEKPGRGWLLKSALLEINCLKTTKYERFIRPMGLRFKKAHM